MERFLRGLDSLYWLHRTNGRIAFGLLVAHALLILISEALRSPIAALRILAPNPNSTVTLGAIALVGMAIAIILTLSRRLNHEMFVYVQRSFGFIFIIGVVHAFRIPGAKALSTPLTMYLAVVAAVALAAFAYRSLFGDVLVPHYEYRVTEVRHLDPRVIEISMEPLDQAVDFTPGQFVFVTFQSEELRKHFRPFAIDAEGEFGIVDFKTSAVSNQAHPFSITSAPGARHLKIVVKALGDFTNALQHLETGARVRVEGPYGSFSYRNIDNRKQIWIAGGIGLTPFLSMARSFDGSDHEVDFYYAMEDRHQGHFLDELYEIADRNPRLRVIPVRKDQLGFVSADDIHAASGDLRSKDILLCGPPGMVDNLTKQFVAAGVPSRQIHFEQFGFAG